MDDDAQAEIARRGLRIAELLAPRASVALRSFVQHVVSISRQHRAGEER